MSTFSWNSTYLLMISSANSTVEETKPGDRNSLRQYTFFTQGKRFRTSRLVFALLFPRLQIVRISLELLLPKADDQTECCISRSRHPDDGS